VAGSGLNIEGELNMEEQINDERKFLFVFEPYLWAYCGGAIGVIARTPTEAKETVITKSGDGDYYKRKNFYLKKSHKRFKSNQSGKWLLKRTIEVKSSEQTRIVFDNWNYA